MRKARSIILLLACTAALAVVPSSASASTLLGFTDDLGRITRAAPAVAGTSQVARIPVSWVGVRQNGWTQLDPAVDAARGSGQRLFFAVSGLQAPDLLQWRLFLTELRLRYPDLWGVQAWNEPNLEDIGGGLTVEQTIAIVQAAREALPDVRLVGPAVSPTVDGADAYQQALYAALPDDIGVGVNIYTYRKANAVPDVVADYQQAKADGGAAEVYVTETGFHGGYFPDQAKTSAQGFEALRQQGAATVIFYRLLSNPASPSKWEQTGNFAVVNGDLSPAPTLIALHNALAIPVDIAAPTLKIKNVDTNREKRRVEIKFTAGDDFTSKRGLAFSCELDKRKPVSCSSPQMFRRVSYGPHRIDVTATDAAGNTTSAFVTFKLRKPRA